MQITLADVTKAAEDSGLEVLEAISKMQAVCAKTGDNDTLDQLCAIKSKILFGDE